MDEALISNPEIANLECEIERLLMEKNELYPKFSKRVKDYEDLPTDKLKDEAGQVFLDYTKLGVLLRRAIKKLKKLDPSHRLVVENNKNIDPKKILGQIIDWVRSPVSSLFDGLKV